MNPYQSVKDFENTIAEYAGAKYGVAVESCTAALFLSLKYIELCGEITIPKRTYPGVACSIINAGGKVKFKDLDWTDKGYYFLEPTNIVDSAIHFKRGMYQKGSLWCLSFVHSKHIPIGRGGMILTDDEEAVKWLKKARFDGRNEVDLHEDYIDMIGWNMYLTPEQASRGLVLFNDIKDKDLPNCGHDYIDLSKFPIYE